MNTSPIMMVSTPPICCSMSRFSTKVPINPNADAVAATNTTMKPATNKRAAPARRHESRAVGGPFRRYVGARGTGEIGEIPGTDTLRVYSHGSAAMRCTTGRRSSASSALKNTAATRCLRSSTSVVGTTLVG